MFPKIAFNRLVIPVLEHFQLFPIFAFVVHPNKLNSIDWVDIIISDSLDMLCVSIE